MISFDAVGVSYADTSDHRDASGRGAPDGSAGTVGTAGATDTTVFAGATFRVPEGELVLVVGPTGSGKSTLLRCINGLVPHFSGGTLHGTVTVAGRDTRTHRPRDLADLVGFVVQDPVASFVT